jgi:hypothetical protein
MDELLTKVCFKCGRLLPTLRWETVTSTSASNDALLTTLDSHISALLDVVPGGKYTVYSF